MMKASEYIDDEDPTRYRKWYKKIKVALQKTLLFFLIFTSTTWPALFGRNSITFNKSTMYFIEHVYELVDLQPG